jgi:glycosyltransferase involved in cell wall biosynthesis
MSLETNLSIILPCLNEQEAISGCLDEIKTMIQVNNLKAEVIVVNNASTDDTLKILLEYKKTFPELIVVHEAKRGYGFAYLKGLKTATGKYICMADADGTYSFSQIPTFIKKLEDGSDLVVGNRFSGLMLSDSMTWSHRYVGNPILSSLVRLLFKVRIKDIHCGIRVISSEALKKITLYTGGMEFASEMIIKAAKAGLKISEIPTTYKVRIGESKLNTMVDGWRHLRFILLYSPLALFFLPGLLIFFCGLILMTIFYFYELSLFGIQFYVHPLFLFSLMILFGYQLIIFGGFSKVYAINHFGDRSHLIEKLFKYITIEKTGLIGIFITLFGAVLYITIFSHWVRSGFNSLNQIKESIIGLTLIMLGAQTFFSSFMFSILGIKEK